VKPEVVYTTAAPTTGFSAGMESPIAQGVKCGDFVFVSGQGPLDAVTKQVVSTDIGEQTRVTLDNVARVLEAAGTSLQHVVKVGVFLRDMKDFDAFNRVFRDYFKGVQPARTTVEASAPRAGVNVEIDAIAWIPR
jgi:2-iminobutanoate/2-iminopropanoate deaminase